MGARGELFTTEVYLDNRSYFFNVKENRNGDVFLQIVESKNKDGADADRHQIAVFADDMQKFLQGVDRSLNFIEKDRKQRTKLKAEKKAERAKKIYRLKETESKKDDGIKRTGRIHVVSKRVKPEDSETEVSIPPSPAAGNEQTTD
ncbi:MAG: PUR family DNA/RNA-binding protein [Treponema sp.]